MPLTARSFLAALGVVMIHIAPSTPAAELLSRVFLGFAVPFFLMIALFFFVEKICRAEHFSIIQLRLDRILVPYAAWTIIYLGFRIVKYKVQHKPFLFDPLPALFYGGTGVQMYFLPLLLLFQGQALAVLLFLRKSRMRLRGLLIFAGAVIFGWFGSYQDYFGFRDCLERGGVFVFFVFLLRKLQTKPIGRRINLFSGGIIALAIVAVTITGYQARWLNYAGGPLAGYSIAALKLNLPFVFKSMIMRYLLTCSYGIYFAHFLFLEIFQFAASKLSFEMAPYSILTKILMSLLISFFCILLIWFARLNRLSAYLLLGENTGADGSIKVQPSNHRR